MTSLPRDSTSLPFDEALAASYVGKYILIGITFLDHSGKELRHQQLHGVVQSASRSGIVIALRDRTMARFGTCLRT